ncbi:MAG: hypothetical protein NC430_13155 [bacterium]|nr:hypothetical protein [bacterium]
MSVLDQYLEKNKELAYKFASENTPRNASGRPVMKKNDEWRDESEWEELFLELSKAHIKENNQNG